MNQIRGVKILRYLITSLKGGVGKSAIALNLAAYTGSLYITNDLTAPAHHDVVQIESDKKRIPLSLTQEKNAVFDFGALSTYLDPKVSQVLNLCDVVIIPTRPDPRSISATLKTYELVHEAGKPIIIIINNFRDRKKHDAARDQLKSALGRIPILSIRETTLFDRISKDGIDWFLNVHNQKGEYQLNKTRLVHETVYDRIIALGVAHEIKNIC